MNTEPAYCQFCRTPLQPGRKFCTNCGKPVSQEVASAAQHCPNCRAPVAANLKFCTRCGAALTVQPQHQHEHQHAPIQQPVVAGQMTSGGQRAWDTITMIGCTVVAGLWYWYSGLSRETPPDTKTCAAIVLLPLALILFRPLIDRALMPAQKILSKIPPFVRLGIGLAMPFLVSRHLYAKGVTEFPFIYQTTVISVIASFLILRNPVPRNDPTRRNV